MIQKLIEFRNKIKSIKPIFTRHDAHKKTRVGEGWRRPKGRQNKMRLHRKGYAKGRSTGYSSPEAVRGLSREGLTQNMIRNIADFKDLNNKTDGVIISRTVGMKKKTDLINYAKENSFTVLNLKIENFEKKTKEVLEQRKKQKEQVMAKRKSRIESSKKATPKKEKKVESEKEENKTEEKSTTQKPVVEDKK